MAGDVTRAIGEALLTRFVLPFELLGVLFLAALARRALLRAARRLSRWRSRPTSRWPPSLFAIGLFGVVTRRNTIGILLGIELMLNAVNINLVAFARFNGDPAGMIFTVFTICITVAEVALGLALVILIFRVRRTVDGRPPRPAERVTLAAMADPASLALWPWLAARRVVPAPGRRRAAAPLRRGPPRWLSILFAAGALAAASARGARAPARWLSRDRLGVDPRGGRRARHRGRARGRRLHADAGAGRAGRPSSSSSTRSGYLADEPPASLGRYYAYQSLFAFSMMGLVLAPNFVQLFICWELVGLCSYLLIGYWYQRPEAARAAVKAFWIDQGRRRGPPDRHRAAVAAGPGPSTSSTSPSWPDGGTAAAGRPRR